MYIRTYTLYVRMCHLMYCEHCYVVFCMGGSKTKSVHKVAVMLYKQLYIEYIQSTADFMTCE